MISKNSEEILNQLAKKLTKDLSESVKFNDILDEVFNHSKRKSSALLDKLDSIIEKLDSKVDKKYDENSSD